MSMPNEIEFDHNGLPPKVEIDYPALVNLARRSGIQEGIEIGRNQIIKTMKAERVDYTLIAKYTGMSVDGVEMI